MLEKSTNVGLSPYTGSEHTLACYSQLYHVKEQLDSIPDSVLIDSEILTT